MKRKKGVALLDHKFFLQCGLKWVCKSYKYNLLPNTAMPTHVHGNIFYICINLYTKGHFNIIDFSPYFMSDIECNITWITLYFEERILNV